MLSLSTGLALPACEWDEPRAGCMGEQLDSAFPLCAPIRWPRSLRRLCLQSPWVTGAEWDEMGRMGGVLWEACTIRARGPCCLPCTRPGLSHPPHWLQDPAVLQADTHSQGKLCPQGPEAPAPRSSWSQRAERAGGKQRMVCGYTLSLLSSTRACRSRPLPFPRSPAGTWQRSGLAAPGRAALPASLPACLQSLSGYRTAFPGR